MDKRHIKVGSFYRPQFVGLVSEVVGLERTKEGGDVVVHRMIYDGEIRTTLSRTPMSTYAKWVVEEVHGQRYQQAEGQ